VIGDAGTVVLFSAVGSTCARLAPAVSDLVLTFFHQDNKLFVPFFNVVEQISILFTVDMQKSGHHNNIFDLTIVVPIVEEFIQSIAGLLSLSDK